ncbi:hypothetical protein FKP32DRAFT_1574398 [Trametes sanguinea]|nr:hypothetical protein FKP32DRAFT_1574398 [Trametes sanguinea]
MPDAHEQEEALAQVVEYINSANAEDRDFDLIDMTSDALADWKEGVEAYKDLTIEQMQQMLGLPSPHFPFFNQKQDPSGIHLPWSEEGRAALRSSEAVELSPFWHQWVGVLKIMDNMMAHKHVLLMDQVGVGKTMQAIGAIAVYEWLRLMFSQKGRYPDRFGTSLLIHAMKADAEVYFNVPLRISVANASDRLPVDHAADPDLAAATLFAKGKEYGVVVMDEAHYARTARATRLAAVELVSLATSVVAMTATPIMTSPMVSSRNL